MTGDQFCEWLDAMRAAGKIVLDKDAGVLLGLHPNSMTSLKKKGGDRRLSLACQCLYRGLPEWGGDLGYPAGPDSQEEAQKPG